VPPRTPRSSSSAESPLFSRLSRSSLEQVAAQCDEVDVAAGTVLMREGQSAGEFFIIVDGSVEVTRDGGVLRTMGPGEFLGEIAMIDGGPRSATATTTSPSRLLVLSRREFHTLLDDHADVRLCVLEALAERVRRLDVQAS
jgi:CRP-like cAMP-binding protein